MNAWQEKWESQCGRVTLYCGDCREVLPHVGKVDAVVTDPPYEICVIGGQMDGGRRKYLSDIQGFTDQGFDTAILDQFENWVSFGTLRQVPKLLEQAKHRKAMLITWNKPNPTPLIGNTYLPDTEYIVHAWSKGGLHGAYSDKARFIVHPAGDYEDGTHPNEKPVRVMNKLVKVSTDDHGKILDPFMGSGTTGVAAVRLGRSFVGIEREAKYFEIAKRRIMEALEIPVPDKQGLKQNRLF